MNSDQLVTAVRASGGLPSADPKYTDARILRELYDAMLALFERPFVNCREGYWLQQHVLTTTAGLGYYRMPHRAVVSNPERIEIRLGAGRYRDLDKAEAREIQDYEGRQGATGVPVAYTLRGEGFELLPTPAAAYTVRVHYYLRPSHLIPVAEPSKGVGFAGLITDIDYDSGIIVVNEVPLDHLTDPSSPAQITSGSVNIDVVRATGGHDLVLVDAPQNLTSFSFGIQDSSLDISKVQVGDYVQAADQSYWPQLPQDYHRTLADAAASIILVSKGYASKAQILAGKVKGDLERLTDLLNPRVKSQPKRARPRFGVLRSGGMRRGWR